MEPLPIACSLKPQDGQERMLRWQRLGELGRPTATRHGGQLEVRFRAVPGVQQELETLAAAEQECCAFVAWTVVSQENCVTLWVTADPDRPDDVAPIAALFGAS